MLPTDCLFTQPVWSFSFSINSFIQHFHRPHLHTGTLRWIIETYCTSMYFTVYCAPLLLCSVPRLNQTTSVLNILHLWSGYLGRDWVYHISSIASAPVHYISSIASVLTRSHWFFITPVRLVRVLSCECWFKVPCYCSEKEWLYFLFLNFELGILVNKDPHRFGFDWVFGWVLFSSITWVIATQKNKITMQCSLIQNLFEPTMQCNVILFPYLAEFCINS